MTVWFQNRRQLSKKNSLIVTAAPQLMSRQPLSTVSHRNIQGSRRQSSVASSTSQSSNQDVKPLQRSSQLKRELWEYLPSSPPTRSLSTSAATSTMPSPLARKIYNAFGTDKENLGPDKHKRKPILEWACARMAKRLRTELDEDDMDESAETLSEDDEVESDRTLADIEFPSSKCKNPSAALPIRPSASLTAIAIPPEYSTKFSPDIVLGASLLLTFQYSMKA